MIYRSIEPAEQAAKLQILFLIFTKYTRKITHRHTEIRKYKMKEKFNENLKLNNILQLNNNLHTE